jgi:excisionase family DNA binding protein
VQSLTIRAVIAPRHKSNDSSSDAPTLQSNAITARQPRPNSFGCCPASFARVFAPLTTRLEIVLPDVSFEIYVAALLVTGFHTVGGSAGTSKKQRIACSSTKSGSLRSHLDVAAAAEVRAKFSKSWSGSASLDRGYGRVTKYDHSSPSSTLRFEQQQLFDPDPLIDKEGAARHLGVELRFITRLVAEKRISYMKVGRKIRFRRSVIEAYIEANTVRATVLPGR